MFRPIRQEIIMLGLIASALWTIISAGDFTLPRAAWHLAGDALAAAGSA